jgi:hypothetical protein
MLFPFPFGTGSYAIPAARGDPFDQKENSESEKKMDPTGRFGCKSKYCPEYEHCNCGDDSKVHVNIVDGSLCDP